MTHNEYESRRAWQDERDERHSGYLVAAGCIVITLAWLAVLAHLGAML